ncbi:uncharacterized protein LOC144477699, partial [Augochlora pura]
MEKSRVRTHNTVVEACSESKQVCTFCSQAHHLAQCEPFKRLSGQIRYQYAITNKCCMVCLETGHLAAHCQMPTVCGSCGRRHHTLLHYGTPRRESVNKPGRQQNAPLSRSKARNYVSPRRTAKANRASKAAKSSDTVTSHCSANTTAIARPVLLATANVRVFGKEGTSRVARALLDQGSETSFISASLANDLRLALRKTPAKITGLGGKTTQTISHSVEMCLGATQGDAPYNALSNLQLADPDPASSHPIEVLIGADLYARVLRKGFQRVHTDGPIVQETAFGWVISDSTGPADSSQEAVRAVHCTALESLDQVIRRFWEVEEIPSRWIRSKAEEECEEFFVQTVKRDATGRFVVRLPLCQTRPGKALGDSFQIALSALTRLRKKLDTNPALVKEYVYVERRIRKQSELLQGGGFHLRKWAGKSADLLCNIPQSAHSHAADLTLFDDSELKNFQSSDEPLTKRSLFSEIAKLYDPLGWLSPVVIRAKILMQSQWLEKIHWDEPVSANTLTTWTSFCQDWSKLNELRIPRWIHYVAEVMAVEIHGFCDASIAAYSAVTYLKVTTMSGDVSSSLLMAKSRVAPIKTQSIPVLVLNGAVLLSELLVHVLSSLAIKVERVVCWTDSTIALAWLKKHASTWKVVIANRVSKIQTLLPQAEWRHVPTSSNPADLNSRGVEAALKQPEEGWPAMPASVEIETGIRVAHAHHDAPAQEWDFLFRYSSWSKLLRFAVYCLRLRKQRA